MNRLTTCRHPRGLFWAGVASFVLAPTLFLLVISGCSDAEEGKAIVTGRIVSDGSPLAVEGREVGIGRVEVILIPVDGGAAETALADADGNFKFTGDGGGIPTGEYKLAVKQIESDVDALTGETDKLGGAFDERKTPIVRDIGEGDVDLGTIDLAEERRK